jgi:hypothetical protein
VRCQNCNAWTAGDREHENWCADMPEWQAEGLGPQRRRIYAMQHSIEEQAKANRSKENLIRVLEELSINRKERST